jgi:hypothetical protein
MALVAKAYCDPPERQAMNIVVGAVKRIYNPSPWMSLGVSGVYSWTMPRVGNAWMIMS